MEKIKSEPFSALSTIKEFAKAAPITVTIGALVIAGAGFGVGYFIGSPTPSEVRDLCRNGDDELLRQFLGITDEPQPAPGPTPEIPRPTRLP